MGGVNGTIFRDCPWITKFWAERQTPVIVMFSAPGRCKSVQKLPGDSRFKRVGAGGRKNGTPALKICILFNLEERLPRAVLRNEVLQGFLASFDLGLFHNNFHRKRFAQTFHPDRPESNGLESKALNFGRFRVTREIGRSDCGKNKVFEAAAKRFREFDLQVHVIIENFRI